MVHYNPILLFTLLLNTDNVTAFTYRDASQKASSWRENISSSVEFPSEELPQSLPSLHWSKRGNIRIRLRNRYCCLVLRASDNKKGGGDGGGSSKKGYRFGDITKSLIGGSVEKITGKPYEFGDLSRAIDSSIKDKVNDFTGKDDYEFGDLSKWVDTKIKGKVNEFTSKESYQFGDLTKEIFRRIASGQYTLDDLFMLLKALAIFEASISPVAGFLPVKLLVELLNFSLLNDVAGRVTSALAMELDKRLKKSLLGDENYKLGDATKRTIASAVQNYTGRETYEFGDVTRKVVSSFTDEANKVEVVTKDTPTLIGMKSASAKDMEPTVMEALDKWDTLSEKQLQDGLDKIEQYVELVEKEQRNEKKMS
mmetsp:Transcript_6472/g.11483  ORF Transcript_6472/g.11483 Transcript_6472/m.11483 type:complete len:367 (+) Transcript_6472:128-1228(+)